MSQFINRTLTELPRSSLLASYLLAYQPPRGTISPGVCTVGFTIQCVAHSYFFHFLFFSVSIVKTRKRYY